jgi:hypothetical protein
MRWLVMLGVLNFTSALCSGNASLSSECYSGENAKLTQPVHVANFTSWYAFIDAQRLNGKQIVPLFSQPSGWQKTTLPVFIIAGVQKVRCEFALQAAPRNSA